MRGLGRIEIAICFSVESPPMALRLHVGGVPAGDRRDPVHTQLLALARAGHVLDLLKMHRVVESVDAGAAAGGGDALSDACVSAGAGILLFVDPLLGPFFVHDWLQCAAGTRTLFHRQRIFLSVRLVILLQALANEERVCGVERVLVDFDGIHTAEGAEIVDLIWIEGIIEIGAVWCDVVVLCPELGVLIVVAFIVAVRIDCEARTVIRRVRRAGDGAGSSKKHRLRKKTTQIQREMGKEICIGLI